MKALELNMLHFNNIVPGLSGLLPGAHKKSDKEKEEDKPPPDDFIKSPTLIAMHSISLHSTEDCQLLKSIPCETFHFFELSPSSRNGSYFYVTVFLDRPTSKG
jgi:hypothetical protein